jgi:hypothetical protein
MSRLVLLTLVAAAAASAPQPQVPDPAAIPAPAPSQPATLAGVLARAGAYVVDFQRQLAGIVAEERYVQDVRASPAPMIGRMTMGLTGAVHRELTSDLLLVRPEGAPRWIQFRDVFEVDGKPVRDRSERLMHLFLAPDGSTARQVEQIVSESSRYNIGNVQRTINVPVLALMVLDPVNQQRFKFKRGGAAAPKLSVSLAVGADVWVVEYAEAKPETLIRTTNNRDLPSRGRFWIEPDSGRVLTSELIAEDSFLRGTIVVSYQSDVLAGLLVPKEMRERYDVQRGAQRVDGAASYGRFRRFQVQVDESIAPIKK